MFIHCQACDITMNIVEANSVLIAYDERGQGWWPADCLEVTPSTATLTEYPAAHDHD